MKEYITEIVDWRIGYAERLQIEAWIKELDKNIYDLHYIAEKIAEVGRYHEASELIELSDNLYEISGEMGAMLL